MTTVTIYDAAHRFGLDDQAFSSSSIANENAAILGAFVSQTNTWGPSGPMVGVPGQVVMTFAGGFTVRDTLTYTSPSGGIVSAVQYLRSATGELLLGGTGAVPFSIATFNADLTGAKLFSGADTIAGNSFNNVLEGGTGNDRVDGGGGTDTALFRGFSSQYTITRSGSAATVTGPDGVDSLLNIERLQFDDKAIAYDISGTGGQGYRLYQAAFNRTPDAGGLGYWIKALDGGASLRDVAGGFVTSAEFQTVYGTNPTNAELVSRYYENVLHRAPEAGGYNYWLGVLDQHLDIAAGVLANISESLENQAGVIGAIQNGFAYTPFA